MNEESPSYRVCVWQEDIGGFWDTDCNKTHTPFHLKGPKHKKYKYCPFCGRLLREVTFEK